MTLYIKLPELANAKHPERNCLVWRVGEQIPTLLLGKETVEFHANDRELSLILDAMESTRTINPEGE